MLSEKALEKGNVAGVNRTEVAQAVKNLSRVWMLVKRRLGFDWLGLFISVYFFNCEAIVD